MNTRWLAVSFEPGLVLGTGAYGEYSRRLQTGISHSSQCCQSEHSCVLSIPDLFFFFPQVLSEWIPTETVCCSTSSWLGTTYHSTAPGAHQRLSPLACQSRSGGSGEKRVTLARRSTPTTLSVRTRKAEMSSLLSSSGTWPRRIGVSSPHLEDRRWGPLGFS